MLSSCPSLVEIDQFSLVKLQGMAIWKQLICCTQCVQGGMRTLLMADEMVVGQMPKVLEVHNFVALALQLVRVAD